jgi:hypothetical protein
MVANRQVYMAKSKETDEIVAIKKIRSLNEVQGVGSYIYIYLLFYWTDF